jgi:hypothetical protein
MPVPLSSIHPAAIFPVLAKTLLAGKGNSLNALDFAMGSNAPEKVIAILQKTAQGAGSLSDPTFAGIADMGWASTAYLESLRTSSAFLRMLDGGLMRAPLRTRLSFSSFNLVGSRVAEGAAKPISDMVIENLLLESHKASAMIVVSRELSMMVSPAAQALISRELRNALGDALDTEFLACIDDTGVAIINSDGSTAAFAASDLKNLLSAVPARQGSKFFFLMSPATAIDAMTLTDSAGSFVFPDMGPQGGMLLGIEALVSTAVSDGEIWLIDGAGILADAEAVTLESSQQATLVMDTAPAMNSTTPTPAQGVSLFQTNSAALKAHIWFGCQRIRADAVARLTSIAWGSTPTT